MILLSLIPADVSIDGKNFMNYVERKSALFH